MIRNIEPTEHQIQCAIVEWANNQNYGWKENKIGDFLLAIPNGGNRSITEAVRIKKEGVKKGVSDLFLAIPYQPHQMEPIYHGLWIEVKRKGGKLSKDQSEWINLVIEKNYMACVVYSVDEGIQAIKTYLGIE